MAMLAKGVAVWTSGHGARTGTASGRVAAGAGIAAAMMRERVRQGDSASHAAERLLKIIERKGVRALEDPTVERRYRTISSVLEVSLELLNAADRRRLAELSIFPEDVDIPLAAAASVWELDEFGFRGLGATSGAAVSAEARSGARGLRLHDVMRSWLAVEDLTAPGTFTTGW